MAFAALTHRLLPIGLLCLCVSAQAAYITDRIEAELYAQPFAQGARLGSVRSGAQVEVLNSDGEYARIRTPDNLTGWIEARFLSDNLSAPEEMQTLQDKLREQTAALKASRDKLAQLEQDRLSDAELKKLRQSAKDAGWLRAELKKAREQIKTLEAAAKTTQAATTDTQQTLQQLRAENADLEQRLAAVLLINDQNGELAAPPETLLAPEPDAGAGPDTQANDNGGDVKLEWFLGSLVSAIIIGIILGISWMDKRLRRRHGGFRIY